MMSDLCSGCVNDEMGFAGACKNCKEQVDLFLHLLGHAQEN